MTSVYVVTGGSARIEREAADHIVRLSFDGMTDAAERWLPAEDYQAMFAPDAIAIARQIAGASRVRIKYPHYQGGEVIVDFDVRGAEEHVASVARRCRWKL
jgi:hypothetical protein